MTDRGTRTLSQREGRITLGVVHVRMRMYVHIWRGKSPTEQYTENAKYAREIEQVSNFFMYALRKLPNVHSTHQKHWASDAQRHANHVISASVCGGGRGSPGNVDGVRTDGSGLLGSGDPGWGNPCNNDQANKCTTHKNV